MLDFSEFQRKNVERCIHGFKHELNVRSLMKWGSATAYEQNISGNKPGETVQLLKDGLAKEIADRIIYSFLWLSAAGYSAEEVIRIVFNAKSDEIGSDIKI